jgi:hypothetical protein
MSRSRLILAAAALAGALAVAVSMTVGARLRTSSSQRVPPIVLGPRAGADTAGPSVGPAEPERGELLIRVTGTLRYETLEDYADEPPR